MDTSFPIAAYTFQKGYWEGHTQSKRLLGYTHIKKALDVYMSFPIATYTFQKGYWEGHTQSTRLLGHIHIKKALEMYMSSPIATYTHQKGYWEGHTHTYVYVHVLANSLFDMCMYDRFHRKCFNPKSHRIRKLRFPCFSRYK